METMTQADFARRHDVSRKTVTKWKQTGLVVMAGESVDVEASDQRLRKYRFAEDGRAQRGARKQAARFGDVPTGRIQLTEAEILRRLRALDWGQDFDWSEDAQVERACLAARCIGFEAVRSDLRDDGHWGQLQLRDPRWVRNGHVHENAIMVGHGFEASPAEVLRVCRNEVTNEEDEPGDYLCTVDVALLPLLAFPLYCGQRQP